VGKTTATGARAVYRSAALGRLPEARAEARAIAPLYPGALLALGDTARESLFKREAPGFRVIHVATHGLLDDRAPMFSSVVLTASDGEDGLLEAREILDLTLAADLVVLSACETARGKIGAGEGVMGLSWAFQVAGVPTLVASQMKAESSATALLMVQFHRHLAGGMAPAAALREAQLALQRNPRYRHPFYWAPFMVLGDGAEPLNR